MNSNRNPITNFMDIGAEQLTIWGDGKQVSFRENDHNNHNYIPSLKKKGSEIDEIEAPLPDLK